MCLVKGAEGTHVSAQAHVLADMQMQGLHMTKYKPGVPMHGL